MICQISAPPYGSIRYRITFTRLAGTRYNRSTVPGPVNFVVYLIHRRLAGDLAFDVEKAGLGLFSAIPIPILFGSFRARSKASCR